MKKIRIQSKRTSEFSTTVRVKGINYHIQTEPGSDKFPYFTTNAYFGGSIVDTLKSPYPSRQGVNEAEIKALMRNQHEEMLQRLKGKHVESKLAKGEYFKKIMNHIKRRKFSEALNLSDDAITVYPDNPFLISFNGFLKAVVRKEHKEGLSLCKDALRLYRKDMAVGGEFYLPVLYLNLGKTYLVAGKKDFALDAFRKGLEFDSTNRDIINELIKLGIRKSPLIPFIPRDSFINKYIGMLLSKIGLR